MTGWEFRGAECADTACRRQAALQSASGATHAQILCPQSRCANNRRLRHGALPNFTARNEIGIGEAATKTVFWGVILWVPVQISRPRIPIHLKGVPHSTVLREFGMVHFSAGHCSYVTSHIHGVHLSRFKGCFFPFVHSSGLKLTCKAHHARCGFILRPVFEFARASQGQPTGSKVTYSQMPAPLIWVSLLKCDIRIQTVRTVTVRACPFRAAATSRGSST